MLLDREINQRRSIRLKGYDYSQAGLYFVTICTHQRQCLFNETGKDPARQNPAWLMIKSNWAELPARFSFIELDDFVVMPNHLHGLLQVIHEGKREEKEQEEKEREGRTQGSPLQAQVTQYVHPVGTKAGSLGRVIQAFKSLTTHQYTTGVKSDNWPAFDGKIWQRDYHDHIVRNEVALDSIRHYIATNPCEWEQDDENPANIPSHTPHALLQIP